MSVEPSIHPWYLGKYTLINTYLGKYEQGTMRVSSSYVMPFLLAGSTLHLVWFPPPAKAQGQCFPRLQNPESRG